MRHGGNKRAGVRMLRLVQDVGGGALLHDAAMLHDGDAVRDFRHHAEIMRDEHHARAAARLDLPDQAQDLHLRRHIERGGGFVGDEQFRLAAEGHRDHDTLLHAAAQLVRVGVQALLRFDDADPVEPLHDLFVEVGHIGAVELQIRGTTRVGKRAPAFEVKTFDGKPVKLSDLKGKIALFSNVPVRNVISAEDVGCIYELPIKLHEQGLDDQIADRLNIWSRPPELASWRRVIDQFTNPKSSVRIGIVGKYVHLKDSYKSLHEALIHGGMARSVRVELDYIDAEELERAGGEKAALAARLRGLDGLLVPGGFGERGSEGKINAIRTLGGHRRPPV